MNSQSDKIRLALIYGGMSGEHAISCATAGAILGALDKNRYDIIPIGIARDGSWVLGENDPQKLILNDATTQVDPSLPRVLLPAGNGTQELLVQYDDGVKSLGQLDIAFPVLHGAFGEDGTVQGLLEMANIPYVGCGVLASAVGMDKDFMKSVLIAAGVPIGAYVAITASRWKNEREAVLAEVDKLQFPLYVKPARAGSSLGITRISHISELEAALATAHAHDSKVIVEVGITGREIECGVLSGRELAPARVAPLGEAIIAPDVDFYDFEHKYISTANLQMQIPANLSVEITQKIQDLAVRTFNAVDGFGLARVDIFLADSGELLVNEINTMPGFTPFSMYPKMWEEAGMEYSQLLDELIYLGLERGISR